MVGTPSDAALSLLVDSGCLPANPLPWVLGSDEPFARWFALTAVVGLGPQDPEVSTAHVACLAHPGVIALMDEVASERRVAGADHHNPLFLPGRLSLLADMGVRRGDHAGIDELLERLADGIALTRPAAERDRREGGAQAPPGCDIAAAVTALSRMGYRDDARVRRGAARIVRTVVRTAQGEGWCCVGQKRPLFNTRRPDVCPQITLEGLLAVDEMKAAPHPTAALLNAARTPLELWRRRCEERPHDFGHGYQFKTVKWPPLWYDALAVVDTVGRYPDVWDGPEADPRDRLALAELAACLIAYNLDPAGRVVPEMTYPGFERFSFGRRGEQSPFATARVVAALARVASLCEEITAGEVERLGGSRGADIEAVPPHATPPAATVSCPAPPTRSYDSKHVLPRILTRHHLDTPWEPESLESITADIVGFTATDPAGLYLGLAARLHAFDPGALDRALEDHHSLVRLRCMRGQLYAIRRDFVPVAHAASSRQVVRRARDFARQRGIAPGAYETVARRVMDLCAEKPSTLRDLRAQLQPDVDLGAVLTLMCAERLLLQCASPDGRFDRRSSYRCFGQVLPDVDLEQFTEDEARPLLLRAFVRGFGPVSHRDAAWWTGMDLKRVRRAFEALEDELVEVSFDGSDQRWLVHAADEEELERARLLDEPAVALLPANDPLIIGYIDRSRFIDDAARPFVFDAVGNAAPVLLINGRVAGVWDFQAPAGAGEPSSVLVFPTSPIDADAVEWLEKRAHNVSSVRFGADSKLTIVTGMAPLTGRPIGAFLHPLR